MSNNNNITLTNGRLTILPASVLDQQQLFAFLNDEGSITVKVYGTAPALADILVYDMNGRLLAKRNLLINNGFASVNVPVPGLQSGVYLSLIHISKRNLLINNGFASVNVPVPGLQSGVYAILVKGKAVDLKTMIQVVK